MKKGDLIAIPGTRRPWYDEGYVPVTRGEVRKVTANTVEVYLYDTKRVMSFDKPDLTEGSKKKHKDDQEYITVHAKRKERK
jgi:hypothetical protein